MIEQATLQVLSELAEIGLPEAVDVQTSVYDPLLRPFLRKRVASAVARAHAQCEGMGVEHELYVAFVLAHPERPAGLDLRDEKAVREVYRTLSAPFTGIPADQALRPGPGAYRTASDPNAGPPSSFRPLPRRKRRWPLTTPMVAAGVVAILGAAFGVAAPYILPTPEDTFRKTALGRALEQPLTAYVSEVGHDEAPTSRPQVLSPAVRRQIGAPAFDALSQTLDLVPVARSAPAASTDDAVASLLSAVNGLDHALADRKVPAILLGYARSFDDDNGVTHRSVWLTSYYVERRTELSFEGWTGHTAWGRRIDGLNLTDDDVYKSDAQDWAMLSLDRVEEELVGLVLGSMATGAPLGPHRYDASDMTSRARVARALGPLIAGDVEACAEVTPEDASRIATALKARNDAAVELRTVASSDRLRLTPWLVRDLDRQGSWSPLVRDLLRTNERLTVYGRRLAPAVDQLARLEEEELMGRLLYAQRLQGTSASKLDEFGPEERAVASSELSLLAHPQPCPRLAFWTVASMAYDPRSRGDYDVGSRVLLELLKELGIPAPANDVLAVGAAIEQVMHASSADVEAAARRAYQTLLGRSAPVFTRAESR